MTSSESSRSTLENWQSEYCSCSLSSAMYIHKGSVELKDSDDRMDASLRRIEQHLGPPRRCSDEEVGELQAAGHPLQVQ